jgi:hypothetical protein
MTIMHVDEPTAPVVVQLPAPYAGTAPKRELWLQTWTASNTHLDRVFLTNDFGHELQYL